MRPYESLRRRADFTRVRRRGRRIETPHVVVLAAPSAAGQRPRVAITTTKAFEGAVERNRARRRVRSALDRLDLAANAFDLILTARPSAQTVSFSALEADLADALGRLQA
ncbi:MAG: ribonuclease P protein component [Candidatus Eremiobacteraeota bacterium]|nr:ribonuclease P protein component [Candidatus Eremiobacteraeota bacterium]